MDWKIKYTVIKSIPGGAQGNCYIVEDNSSKKQYFLKALKNDTHERRLRFFRETIFFKSLDVPGIPHIIDTNADDVSSQDELYYCSELINGKRLDEIIHTIKETQIIDLFKQLLIILDQIHSQEIVHRDIKPENIIVDGSGKLYLVDFGISTDSSFSEHLTPAGQEIGNRFIRLPEFSAGSTSKRDVRSDITLACGIALYMIVKEYPRNLVNEHGEYPHQTDNAIKNISKLGMYITWNMIFDTAFQQPLSKRWSNTGELLEIINNMKNDDEKDNIENITEQLKQHAKLLQSKNLGELKSNLTNLNSILNNEVYSILSIKAPGFRTEEMGYVYNLGDLENKNQIRAYPIGKMQHVVINIKTLLSG